MPEFLFFIIVINSHFPCALATMSAFGDLFFDGKIIRDPCKYLQLSRWGHLLFFDRQMPVPCQKLSMPMYAAPNRTEYKKAYYQLPVVRLIIIKGFCNFRSHFVHIINTT
jgi:hypothetical protein